MKVPLRHSRRSGGSLCTGEYAQCPEIVQKEDSPEPPSAQVDNPTRGCEMASEEQSSEHEDPDPGVSDYAGQRANSHSEQVGLRLQYIDREFQHSYSLVE